MESNVFKSHLEKITNYYENSEKSEISELRNHELLENALSEKYDDVIFLNFTLDFEARDKYREKMGLPRELEHDEEINTIINKIGKENWEKVLERLYSIYPDYIDLIEYYKDLDKHVTELRDSCADLSSLLRKKDLNKFSSHENNPFKGIIAKYVMSEGFLAALSSLPSKFSKSESDTYMYNVDINSIWPSAFNILPAILDDFVKVFDEGIVDKETQDMLNETVNRKTNFREYVKRKVPEIIREFWVGKKGYREAAITLANPILDHGEYKRITVDDVSAIHPDKGDLYKYSPFYK